MKIYPIIKIDKSCDNTKENIVSMLIVFCFSLFLGLKTQKKTKNPPKGQKRPEKAMMSAISQTIVTRTLILSPYHARFASTTATSGNTKVKKVG